MNLSDFDNYAFLNRITAIVEANLTNEQFSVSLLAREMGMSRSNLHRKIKSETGRSVSHFINQVRLSYAKELLKKSNRTVSQVAYESGFHSVTYFSTCFRDFYGYSPGKIINDAQLADEQNEKTREKTENSNRSKKHLVLSSSLVILPLVLIAMFFVFYFRPFHWQENSPFKITVLPVEFGYADSSGQTLVYAVMFQMIKNLSELENFEVRLINNNTEFPDNMFMSSETDNNENTDYIIESKVNISDEIEINLKKVGNDEFELSETFSIANDIFYPAAQMAFKIAASINFSLSNEEKAAFEKVPTNNRNALLKYQLGLSYKSISDQGKSSESLQNLLKAKSLFEDAVKLDSAFTEAYIELGQVHIDNLYFSAGTMLQGDEYLESGYKLVQKALELDEENKDALKLLGRYNLRKGKNEKANRIFAEISRKKGVRYDHFINEFDVSVHYEDYCNAVQNYLYYVRNKPVNQLTPKYMLYNVALVFSDTGFPEVGREYARKLLTNYNDSVQFYRLMGTLEMRAGNYNEAIEWHQKTGSEREFSSESHHFFKFNYIVMGDLVNAAEYLKKWEEAKKNEIRYPSQYYIAGMICRRTGQEEKALAYFKDAEKNLLEAVNRKTRRSQIYVEQFYLAGVYFELNETEKAIKYLSMLKERKTIPNWIVLGFENWPPLSERRSIPEIEAIYHILLIKFNREHNRISNLLIKEGEIERIAQKTIHPR